MSQALAFTYDGMETPFGTEAGVRIICEGIAWVDTSEHGGFKLSDERNKQIPYRYRIEGGWYEEDYDWRIVAITFAKELKATGDIEWARAVKEAQKEGYEG